MSNEQTFAEETCARYEAFLKEEGFKIEKSVKERNDCVLIIKAEGRAYLFVFDGDDKGFIRIVYPNFWEIESKEEYVRALQASNAASAKCKFVKLYVIEDQTDTTASLEFFDDKNSADVMLIKRYLGVIQNGVNTFRTEMQKGMQ
jgi:hypothetical protein